MKKLKNVLVVVLFFITATVLGQAKISGTVVDELGESLPGASVVVKGTTNGTATDFDGNFILNAKSNNGAVIVSFVGYSSKTVAFNGTTNLGKVQLQPDGNVLDEVVIKGVIDVAKDRETPVAVSTIKASEIQEKLGSQEFPEILKSTPSIYATKSGGGFGDARVNIRGFSQENIAVLVNGVPVNDMENSKVYWSNWAGISDVTSAMQVQRGLGSSKLAISSVGGTINIITKTSEQKKGGSVGFSTGNDAYMKFKASYSTGRMDNGLSASILLSRTQGDGYVDGTKFLGHNYFIGLGYEINDKHQLEFTFTGAPQWHHQRYERITLADFLKYGKNGDPNIKYNSDWGYLNGQEYSWRKNFYHKPVMSLNWDWEISDNSNLSTIAYASWGRGGGSGPIGKYEWKIGNDEYEYDSSNLPRVSNGLVDFEFIKRFNQGNETITTPQGVVLSANSTNTNGRKNAGFTRRASINSHNWYGLVANFHNEVNENLNWDLGIDMRTYTGIHYRVVTDILGASGYLDNKDKNNPNRAITEFVSPEPSFNPWQSITDQQKIEYYNDGNVNWLGGFGQVEYKNDDISAFVQAGVSRQGFQRIDYFNLTPDVQKSDYENIWGGNVKGGINWNINEQHNIFANAGYYSKQPNFRAVYPNYTNNNVSPGLTNEKIIGVEAGYGFKHSNYNVKLNVYRTQWKDRFLRGRGSVSGNYVDFAGITQVHTGLELETVAKFDWVNIEGMFSVGNFEYEGNVTGTEYTEDRELVGTSGTTYYLDGIKVGDSPELTARLGLNFKITENFKFDISQFYTGNIYPTISAKSFRSEADMARGSLKLPAYSLVDAGVSYKWNVTDNQSLNFRVNVNNLANKTYISDGYTNIHTSSSTQSTYKGIDTANEVFFGYGRTWNASVRYSF